MRYFLILLTLLAACSPNSSEEFQREGRTRCGALIQDLEKIENREQLLRAEPRLKKHFEALISLMIEAREFGQQHVDESDGPSSEFSGKLEEELRRIYAIEGGREVIERSQNEGLVRLDAYERALAKKRAR